jgi:4-hydroxy-2-oxoglutarate aldolase
LSEAGIASRLTGVFLPVTTPFDAVTGDVAPVSFRENLRKWVEQPIDGIVLFGSTGEGALLDEDEKTRLTGFAREVVPAGLPLIAGASGESTRATVRKAKALAAAGADAVLVHPPAYFGPYISAAATADHFRAVADASPVPIILYHMPKYTKVTLEPGLIAELTRHPNVVGVKDSSGDIKRFADYTNVCPRGCRLFVGNGTLLYTALELGAAGGILAIAVFAPARCAEVVSAFRAGDTRKAGQVQERLTHLHREIVATFGAVGVKAALDLAGYTGGPPRPPLRPLADKEKRQVARVMQEASLI